MPGISASAFLAAIVFVTFLMNFFKALEVSLAIDPLSKYEFEAAIPSLPLTPTTTVSPTNAPAWSVYCDRGLSKMVRFLFCLGRNSKSSETRSTPLTQTRQVLLDSGLPSQSGVFGRLPFEIRHMIYVYALGGNLLHLTREDPSRHMTYRSVPSTQPILLRYYGRTEPYPLLCLLQTCRQIYVEASPVLYSTNTIGIFGVNGLSIFREFSQRIHRAHLDVITSICINCQVNDYDGLELHETGFLNNWRQTWEVLATQMVGLRDLEVQLFKTYFPQLKLSLQEDWVKPMLEVRGLRRFEFDLAQGIGSDESTADYNEELEWFQRELRSSACSAK